MSSEHHFRAPRPGIKSEHSLSLANMIPLNGANKVLLRKMCIINVVVKIYLVFFWVCLFFQRA